MERKLKKLFDYQKFEKNPKLAKMIEEAENTKFELSDDELGKVVGGVGDDKWSIGEWCIGELDDPITYHDTSGGIYEKAYNIYGKYEDKLYVYVYLYNELKDNLGTVVCSSREYCGKNSISTYNATRIPRPSWAADVSEQS